MDISGTRKIMNSTQSAAYTNQNTVTYQDIRQPSSYTYKNDLLHSIGCNKQLKFCIISNAFG